MVASSIPGRRGYYWDGCDCIRMGKPPRYFTKPLRPTQPLALSGMRNEYRPKCGDAPWLGSKGRYGSFHLWRNVWVAGELCDSSLTCANLSTSEMSMSITHYKALYKCPVYLLTIARVVVIISITMCHYYLVPSVRTCAICLLLTTTL